MKLYEFIKMLSVSVINFHSNLQNLGMNNEDNSKKRWMEIFLAWMEWETDMHSEYWEE